MIVRACIVAIALAAGLAAPASAQERYRRPYEGGHRLNYGFDHAGGGGCDDYECGGACYDTHGGSDFGTPFGTNVLAGADGTVSYVHNGCANYGSVGNSCGSYCGNYVRIDHVDGSRTIYCHMQLDSIPVRTGDRVACGQLIGRSASSGSSSGPHLHFGYRRTADSAYADPFHGACSSAASRWVMQAAYRDAPGTACSCVASPEVCNGRDDDCDGASDEDDVCEIAQLQVEAAAYAPPGTTDIDGDGRADVCARGSDGVHCWIAGEGGYAEAGAVLPLDDASGWDDPANYATLRMGDVDGDGRADLCARADDGVHCALSTGAGLGALVPFGPSLSDANGWAEARFYTTLRLADVDGDGRDDLCARDSEGFGCWISDGARFDRRIEGPRWSDAGGWGAARHHGTIRMGDLDADGRADVCARAAAGIECWLSDGEGFPTQVAGPEWSDDRGWGAPRYWTTLRLADVDGDGRDDLCARNSVDLRCLTSSDGAFFDRAVVLAGLADASGWDDVSNYATLRAGDIDGDGRDDLCARANDAVVCWALHGETPIEIQGPAWADASGWGSPQYYETMRLADVDGDGSSDLCARSSAGWECTLSTGTGFDATIALDAMRDDRGFAEARYWSTIFAAGNGCTGRDLESCDGTDDDCDGAIDEDGVCELGDGSVPSDRDGGATPRADGSTRPPVTPGSCGCAAPGRHAPGSGWIALALVALVAVRRRARGAAIAALALVAGCALGAPTGPEDRHDGGSIEEIDAAIAIDATAARDARGTEDVAIGPSCRGMTQPCASDDVCCDALTCGSTMLGRVCCAGAGAACTSGLDCCGGLPCESGRCTEMCRPAREACTATECCAGLTCGTTSLGRTCCGEALTPCSTSDGSDCCGDLLCGTTSAGRVCCGGTGASCSTSDGRDCCGSLDCVGGRCQ